jgi:hypothetical protein
LLEKSKSHIAHPPLPLRERILDKYHQDLFKMDYIDAFVLYEAAMHKIYVKLNPWLARNKYGKPTKTRTRRDFGPKEDFIQ